MLREKLGWWGEGDMNSKIGVIGSPHSLVFPAVKAGRKRAPGSTVTSFNSLNAALMLPRALPCCSGACCRLSRLFLPALCIYWAVLTCPWSINQLSSWPTTHWMYWRQAPEGICRRWQRCLHLGWQPADVSHTLEHSWKALPLPLPNTSLP